MVSLLNASSDIGQVIATASGGLTGDVRLTFLMIVIVLIAVLMLFGVKANFIIITLMPLFIIIAAYTGDTTFIVISIFMIGAVLYRTFRGGA